jgi:predicted DNA-binding protein with PD1-like motif
LSLTGNIYNQDYEYVLHLHAVLGNERKNAIGGHFIDGTVTVTGEIVLLKTDIIVGRVINKKTGLKNLLLE